MKLGVGPAVATVVRAVDDVSGASFLDRHAQGDGLENVHAFFTPTTLQWMLKTLIAGIARIVTAVARASGRGAARGMWDVELPNLAILYSIFYISVCARHQHTYKIKLGYRTPTWIDQLRSHGSRSAAAVL